MRAKAIFTLVFWGLAAFVWATGFIILDSPQDDLAVRAELEKTRTKQLGVLGDKYASVIKQLSRYPQIEVDRLFGVQTTRPASAVRPVFGGHAFILPGIVSNPHHGLFNV